MEKSFSATIDEWVRKTEARELAVFRESAQRVTMLAARNVPVDTGFARASVMASTNAPIHINTSKRGAKDSKVDSGGSFASVTLVINGAELSQTIYVGWTASYIVRLEYGHSQQAPNGFLRLAAAQWQRIVNQVVEEAKQRS